MSDKIENESEFAHNRQSKIEIFDKVTPLGFSES